MEYINLGKSDLKVSRLGFGCCPMGCHGWGKVSEDELREAVLTAVDNGVTIFDTADIYGFGRSEELLGRFLDNRKKEVVIATKFGVRRDRDGNTFFDSSPAWIEEALEGSIKRLGVECIDLYHVHYLDGRTPIEDTIAALEARRAEGKIKYYGFSNIVLADIAGPLLGHGAVSFQEEYSLAKRGKEKIIDEIRADKGLSFFSWGSLGQGVLSGKYGPGAIFGPDDRRSGPAYDNFHGEKFKKNVVLVENIRMRFAATGKTISQIAIRWLLDRFDHSVALVGIKKPSQIVENIGALGWMLSDEEMAYLNSLSQ